MSWVPPDLATLCQPHIRSTSCSPSAVLFLQLVAQLFGYSPDQTSSTTYDSFFGYPGGQPNQYSSFFEYSGDQTSPLYDNFFGSSSFFDNADFSTSPYPQENVEEQQTIEEYDFVIVGAGSAGCVVANRLSEIKEWKILLLEAGIEEPFAADVPAFAPLMQQSNIDWNYRTQPEKYSCRALPDMGCGWARGKVMGGSSSINYMIYMRGNRKDYDGWAARGNPGWHYKEVLHYFLKSEDNKDHDILHSNPEYHHRGGYQTVERFPYQDNNIRLLIDAWKELGYPEADMNADSQLGVMLYQHTSRHGERLSTNGAFIRPIRRKRRNLTIRTQAHVTRILIDQHTKQAFGVEYIRDGDDSITTVTARKEVILSAGSINSPKILMLSGVGPKKHLDYFGIHVIQNLKVGENLHDHVTIGGVIISINKTAVTASDEQRIEDLQKYRQNRKGPLSATGPIQVGVFIETEYSEEDDAPDIQLTFDSVSVMDYITNPTLQPNAQPLSYYDAINLRPIVLQPRSRGRVLLNTTDPIWGAPRIYPNYFGDYRDMKTLIAGIRHGLDMLSTEPLRHMGAQIVDFPVPECAEYKFASDDYWRCLAIFYTATIFHPVGTCKMGPHYDSDAVVDPELRVYGIENLRVIDSSIMPKIPRGNTNAPTIMIGEKGSDMIKKRWLQSYEQN